MSYGVLGPVEAKRNDVVVAVGGPQQRRLLALMLSRPGQSISTQRLVDCLWPDGVAPDGAARSAMSYVSRLRAALGDTTISTVQEGYCFELNGSTLDSRQFESWLAEAGTAEPGRAVDLYDRALALWRGSAYGEFGSEWWLLAEASRLDELRVVAMEERAEALLALGHHHRVIPELNRLTTEHPLRERPVSLLMQALFATGRHADAFREYQSFRTRLVEETGLEPSAELAELDRSMAAGRPVPNLSGRSRLLRGYAVHEVLGEGAFGRVFAATQPGTNREVAIKAIRPDLSDSPEFIQRFEAEAQLVSRLEHPHIVPLHDYWREPGGAYLVFRLLSGGTAFAAMVKDGPFSVARVSRLVEEVGSALLAAHTAGVVHCDVKPSNVLFDEAGNAYLSDFGIAVASPMAGGARERTRVYAAPELEDRAGDTVRSDIYSFGCMLWELLVGVSPLADIEAARRKRVPSLVGRISEQSEALDAVLSRAMAPDPDARYESMADLIVAWREAVGRPEGVLTPMGSPTGSSPYSSRRRAVRALSVAVSSAVNPYMGLRPFAEADASGFFGRDQITAALRDTLKAREFVTVVGPSGSGKSSLVHAGLVPRLRHDGSRIATMLPGARPTAALRQALRQVAASDVASDDVDELFREAVREGAGQMVLVIDQFEECWTMADNAERERFLSSVVTANRHGVRCVATVRSDLYDRPLQHPLIGQMVADGTFALPPLSIEALEEAIVRPAERNGVDFDDGVVTAIAAEANAQPAGLPLLQFAMAELYERRVDNCMTAAALHEFGGIGGAIGRRAENIYMSLDTDLRAHARQLLGRLITPGQGTPDTRRRARLGELSESARLVADRFVQARLLVADRDLATREPVIEVAHEALLTNWPRLREWLETDRQWLAQLQHLAAATDTWDNAGRAEGELYRGSRLEAVLEASADHTDQLSSEEHEFIEASRAARDSVRDHQRRTARRLRRLLTATACLLALAVVAGTIALTQRQRADRSRRGAEITTLANRSIALRSSQRDTAALLAVEAHRLRADSESASALFATFTRDPGFLGYYTFPGGAQIDGAIVPGTNTAIVSLGSSDPNGANPPLRRIDLTTGELGPQFEPMGAHDSGNVRVAVSGNGAVAAETEYQFANGNFQGPYLALFDTATGRKLAGPISLSSKPEGLSSLAMKPDGSQVAVAGGFEGLARVYSVPSGTLLTTLKPPPDMVPSVDGGRDTASAAWSPDGRLYVGSSGTHLRVFDPTTFALAQDIIVSKFATGGLLKFSDDGAILVTRGVNVDPTSGEQAGSVSRIDLPGGTVRWTMSPEEYGFGNCDSIAFAAAEDRLWCGDYFGVIRGRSLTTGALDGTTIEHQRGWLSSLELSQADGVRTLVSFGQNSPSIGRWSVDGTGPIMRRIATGQDGAAYSPDGRRMLTYHSSDDPAGFSMSIWDPSDDHRIAELPTGTFDGAWIDANRVAALTADGAVRAVDARTGTVSNTPTRVDKDWLFISRVADGVLAFGYADGHVDVVHVDGDSPPVRAETGAPATPGQFEVAASTDGTRIYVSGLGLWVFDAATGRQIAKNTNRLISSVAAGRDGVLAVGYGDGRIGLLRDSDLSEQATLPGARGWAPTLRFSDDGRILLARAADRTMSLYDVTSRQRLGDSIAIGNGDADLRPDGDELTVINFDGSSLVRWSLDPTTWADAACRTAGRNLTKQEWSTYIGGLEPYHATCPEFAVPTQ